MYSKKIVCVPLFLTLLLVLLITSFASVKVYAATIGFKKILIGDTDITDRGSAALSAGSGSISWNYKTSTLTLDNATVDSITIKASYADKDINILLIGDNYSGGTIYADCNLTISGDEGSSLNVTASKFSYGIRSKESVAIYNSTINVSSLAPAIYAAGDLSITDSHITAKSTRGTALYAGGTLTAASTDGTANYDSSTHNRCSVDADAYYCALSGLSGINIDRISLNAHSATYFVLYSENSDNINIAGSVASIISDDDSFASYPGIAAYVGESSAEYDAASILNNRQEISDSDAATASDWMSGTESNASNINPGMRQRSSDSSTESTDSETDSTEQLISPPTGENAFAASLTAIFMAIFISAISLVLISSRRGRLYPHRSLRK